MIKKLKSRIVRDSGLKTTKGRVLVVLEPSCSEDEQSGGYLGFLHCGKKKKISLQQILSNMINPKATGLMDKEKVDLNALESRIMIQHESTFTPEIKGYLFHIIRQIRDEKRKERGMPPVIWRGTKPEIKKVKKK